MSLSCKKCDGLIYVKNGFVHGNQRYLCKTCGHRFTDTPGAERQLRWPLGDNYDGR